MSKNMHKILNGNEIIIQGALEAGFHLFTGYPGSPLADYFNILYDKKNEFHDKGIRVVIANSEANAAAMASGAKQANKNAIVAMKSMGLHVASDPLSVGNFSNPGTGGVVIVVGDDPWSISTSSPADSRYLFKHLHIPFLDPSTPQELKDWIKIALELSLESSVYQGLLLTTFMAEGGGPVYTYEEAKIDSALIELDPKKFDLSKNVMVPPNSYIADVAMIKERFPKVLKALKQKNLDIIFGNKSSKIGIISSGAAFEILKHVLDDNCALDCFSLYKVAAPYPLISELLLPYLSTLDSLIVVEEKRGFLENELHELISKNNLKLKIYGKMFDDVEGFPIYGGLNYEIILEKLGQLFNKLNLGPCHSITPGKMLSNLLPRRLPTFCPGCPHRETLSLLKDLRGNLLKQNINLITHGDVGCYSLSFLEPFKEMHNLSGMGQGGALGAGLDLFTVNPSVVLMGDSTFFHSGITDISNSVQMDHSITYILLDNDNTAMTGHQMTPRTGESVEGFVRPKQDILNLVKSLGVKEAIEVNPSDRYFYQNILKETILKKGVKVIISNKECGLTFHGKKKHEDRKLFQKNETLKVQSFYQINTDACEDCRECVTMTGCPGLTQVFDAYGTKVAIDPQICVADSYCTKIKACPSFERVDVFNYHPTKYKEINSHFIDSKQIVEPIRYKSLDDIANGDDYRIVVTGVGGTGVTTISKILSLAALNVLKRGDLDFKFVDQKGLAQRNGNVTGHVMIFKKGKSHSQITPVGGADLLISPDILDGSQHLRFVSTRGHIILDSLYQVPLSILLDRNEHEETINEIKLKADLEELLKERISINDFKSISEKYLGRNIYVSSMLIGFAYQLGRIPFAEDGILKAIESSVPKAEIENNKLAFTMGRLMKINPDNFKIEVNLNFDIEIYIQSINQSHFFKNYTEKFKESFTKLNGILSNASLEKKYLAQYLHDLFVYDGAKNIDQFMGDVSQLYLFYKDDLDLLKMSIRTLARTYFIKDEIFVAHQMISPQRLHLDQTAYTQLGTHFKKSFINRPSFNLSQKMVITFDFSPKNWMLKIMRLNRFWRRLLPLWHKREREINEQIRLKLISNKLVYSDLKKLENIKGYRDVRYDLASRLLM